MVGDIMNILMIITHNPFVQSNAPSNRFLTIAEGLAKNGAGIDLLFINGYSQKEERKKFGKYGKFQSINYSYLIPYNYFSFPVRAFYLRILPISILKQKILNVINNKKYDYVWLGTSPQLIRVGIELLKCKIEAEFIHERSEYSWISLQPYPKIHQDYLKFFIPRIDIFAVMTYTLLDYYKTFIGSKTKMIHLPMTVDFSRFNLPLEKNDLKKPYIGYCGAMLNAKDGVDILIKSFIRIMDKYPELHLYLAGPLHPEKDYQIQKSIISENQAHKRITYLGPIPKEEMPIFLYNSEILAIARPESKQAEGGFPTKLGEYLATGRPVCATTVGELPKYLSDNKSVFFAVPGSVESFSEALERALNDKNAKEIGMAGRNIALEHFNKEIQAKLLYEFLLKNIN
jgi:glycosyltransferase involved in cell wall biosynthesis